MDGSHVQYHCGRRPGIWLCGYLLSEGPIECSHARAFFGVASLARRAKNVGYWECSLRPQLLQIDNIISELHCRAMTVER